MKWPMSLKEQMEQEWEEGGCQNPLTITKWGLLGIVLRCLNSIRWNYFN